MHWFYITIYVFKQDMNNKNLKKKLFYDVSVPVTTCSYCKILKIERWDSQPIYIHGMILRDPSNYTPCDEQEYV